MNGIATEPMKKPYDAPDSERYPLDFHESEYRTTGAPSPHGRCERVSIVLSPSQNDPQRFARDAIIASHRLAQEYVVARHKSRPGRCPPGPAVS